MYTINIISAYTNIWNEMFNNKRAAKAAFKAYLKNAAYGEQITLYTPAGTVMKQVTK